jgi:hypothetical protein
MSLTRAGLSGRPPASMAAIKSLARCSAVAGLLARSRVVSQWRVRLESTLRPTVEGWRGAKLRQSCYKNSTG